MYVPHAIDVDGQIITMFDPINHVSLETDDEAVEHHRHRRRAIADGFASAGRWSWSAAS